MGIPQRADGAVQPKLTMCTFQETYLRTCYWKFMGAAVDNPRADCGRFVNSGHICTAPDHVLVWPDAMLSVA
jgi:hypothetical protein